MRACPELWWTKVHWRARAREATPLDMAELKVRCAACNLDVVMGPPMFTSFNSDNSVAEAP